jgi:uncharacterized membrane protein
MPHGEMTTRGLEAFSDGVIAVIVTITVLQLHPRRSRWLAFINCTRVP